MGKQEFVLHGPGTLLISRQFFHCVGAGNAVRFGDSGAAVTGYEIPTTIQREKVEE